jgi:hypothetical protein
LLLLLLLPFCLLPLRGSEEYFLPPCFYSRASNLTEYYTK